MARPNDLSSALARQLAAVRGYVNGRLWSAHYHVMPAPDTRQPASPAGNHPYFGKPRFSVRWRHAR